MHVIDTIQAEIADEDKSVCNVTRVLLWEMLCSPQLWRSFNLNQRDSRAVPVQRQGGGFNWTTQKLLVDKQFSVNSSAD